MTDHDDLMAGLANQADRAHRHTPGADTPPADLWQQVLSQTLTQEKEESIMSSATLTTPTAPRVFVVPESAQKSGARRNANLVATIAMVLALAVGGWFAAMQLNQPGDPEPRLAVLPATPHEDASPTSELATCDVEPLDADTVMEIVKNPARFMANGPTGEPSDTPMSGSPPKAELWQVNPDLELTGDSGTPSEEQFDDASEFADHYLDCLMHGTQAQIWTFYSPVLLQQKILGEFPVFAEESQVRERVEEMSTQSAYFAELAWEDQLAVLPSWAEGRQDDESHRGLDPNIGSVTVNPDYQLARVQQSDSFYYESVLSVGISIKDVDGNQLVLTNGVGTSLIPREFGNQDIIYVQVAKLRHSDTWVIIPWPSESELGFDHY